MCFLPPGSLVIMELHVILLLQVCLACESFVHRHSVGAAAPSLDARPSTLKYSGDNVTIAWKDIDSPSKDDWLGIYSPPTSANDQYIGFIILSTCPTWSRGAGSMKIPLVNMRGPYNFRIFRGISVTLNATSSRNVNRSNNRSTTTALDKEGNPLPDVSTLLAISQDIHFSNYNEPTQIHLALTSNETAVRVMFVTKDPVRSKVRFGSGEDNLETTVEANFVTYSQIDMCDEPASSVGWRDPGYIHDAVMEGLIYGGRYYYQASYRLKALESHLFCLLQLVRCNLMFDCLCFVTIEFVFSVAHISFNSGRKQCGRVEHNLYLHFSESSQ